MGRPCQECIDAGITECQCSEGGSATISVLGDGSVGNPFIHSVKKSAVAGNAVVLESDGIYVPTAVPLCRIYAHNTQNIPSVTDTAITFDGEHYDTDNMHDFVVNPTRITFNTAGFYHFGSNSALTPVTNADVVFTSIRLNGSRILVGDLRTPTGTATNRDTEVVLNTIWKMSVGDYIELMLFHNDSTTLHSDTGDAFVPEFWAYWFSS